LILTLLLLSVSLMIMIGCQSKEVTSAKVYIQQDDWDKAIEQLETAVQLYPADGEAHLLLGQGYGKKGLYEKMVKELDQAAKVNPALDKSVQQEKSFHWTTEFNNGVKSYKENDLTLAAKHFETAIMLDSSRGDAYKNLASCYQAMDTLQLAVDIYQVWVKKSSKDVEAMLRLHGWLTRLEKVDDGIVVLNKAREVEPENVDVLSSLAISYDMKGETSKAFEIYNQALAKNPKNVDLLFNLGRLYFLQGDYDKAIENFNTVISQNPDDFESNLNVGNAYLSIADKMSTDLRAKEEEKGKEMPEERAKIKEYYRLSVPYLEKALEIKPDNANAWNNLGVAYIRTDNLEKGQEAFKKAEELNKGN
ncbi:tetratricopeptide repeat protein, partial [candidate division KSB1 bacterium]|nr:tetratricopeptide repeat protein [candidate division KSB1 bacterium]